MKRKERISSIVVVLVSLILLTFSILILSPVNSWFTSGSGLKLKFEIAVGDIMVTVKQKISEDKTLILYEGGEYPDKIDISSSNGVKEILPDTEYGLELEMSNADIGVGKVKLKFKAQFYAIGMNEDILLDSSLIGYQAPSESEAGFVRNLGTNKRAQFCAHPGVVVVLLLGDAVAG